MGIFRDFIDGVNSLANYKKADVEQIKAQTQNDKLKKARRENRELKKAISRSNLIGIIGIIIAIAGIAIGLFFVYFPIHHT